MHPTLDDQANALLAPFRFWRIDADKPRRDLVRQLTLLRAFSEASAADLSSASSHRRGLLAQLVESDKIRTDRQGRYWLRRRHEWRIMTLKKWAPVAVFVALLVATAVLASHFAGARGPHQQ